MKKLLLPLFFFSSLFAYKSYAPDNTLDTHMTPGEEKMTGIYKLTPQEKKSLQKWINKHHVKRPGTSPSEYPTVSEVIAGGSFVKLSDGSLWQIAPNDRAISQSWITPAEIIPEESGNAQYPYTLTNSLTSSKVRAKKIRSLPSTIEAEEILPSEKKEPAHSKEIKPKTQEKPAKNSLSSWLKETFFDPFSI